MVHFGSFYKIPFLLFFAAYRAASIWALASSTTELLMELKQLRYFPRSHPHLTMMRCVDDHVLL